MKSPSQEDLLGYLLGALDAREQEQVQQLIDQHPSLEEKLLSIKAALAPLEQLDEPTGPPPGLARRCCQFVATTSRQLASGPAGSTPAGSTPAGSTPAGSAPAGSAPLSSAPLGSAFAESGDSRFGFSDALVPEEAISQAASFTSVASDLLRPAAVRNTRTTNTAIIGSRPLEQPADEERLARRSGSWSLTDLVFACAAAMLVSAVLLPALSAARFNSRMVACQNNMRSVFNSLAQYAETHEGQFPEIPESGPLAAAGYVGPLLKSEGLLENERVFTCAGLAGENEVARIPTTGEILAAQTPQELQAYRQRMLGHFGYALGHLENGKHVFPKNLGQGNYVILADAPHNATPARVSRNHGGWGQNCLMTDGSVRFNRTGFVGSDAIYVNDRNVVAPGVSPLDAVIAPGHIELFGEPFGASVNLQ